jgi:hypothetical protein
MADQADDEVIAAIDRHIISHAKTAPVSACALIKLIRSTAETSWKKLVWHVQEDEIPVFERDRTRSRI